MNKFEKLTEDQVTAIVAGFVKGNSDIKITITEPTIGQAFARSFSRNQWLSILVSFIGGAMIGVAIYLALGAPDLF